MPHASKRRVNGEKKPQQNAYIPSLSNPLRDPTERISPPPLTIPRTPTRRNHTPSSRPDKTLYQPRRRGQTNAIPAPPSRPDKRYTSPAVAARQTPSRPPTAPPRSKIAAAHPGAAGAAQTRIPHRSADRGSTTARGDRRRGARGLGCVTLGVLSVLGHCAWLLCDVLVLVLVLVAAFVCFWAE
ncbi:hypothetical protein VC83_00595 [Pseudogymnoascus destructans]|uniref:Uncharacterized protein n=1 Tax=Pseudogymnoascus destructans TaxID=655981 RepID=A0A177AP06_9PEZI|nr:uncharacterized protein VC83_00595 [Pseudogymnoascus destructans]OAF63091.1 hypothetical protein VC83_00595 [Pseudogymnoascus destructans]